MDVTENCKIGMFYLTTQMKTKSCVR